MCLKPFYLPSPVHFLYVIVAAVVCDPPCEQGTCIGNNTCNCMAGFSGNCTVLCNLFVFFGYFYQHCQDAMAVKLNTLPYAIYLGNSVIGTYPACP